MHLHSIDSQVSYQLVRPLAQGGMGMVYEAIQLGPEEFRKRVAIKLIREEYSAVAEFRRNFIGEARLVADLIHTNIVQTYHLGQHAGQFFMVMELVRGRNLEEFILQHRALNRSVPVDIACFIISRLCRGLGYAHAKRDESSSLLCIVHRDVSPRNIMLGNEGDVKLTDFGIAKAFNLMYNREGDVIAGKDEYLSPEQARREITDRRADIFACGVLLAELLFDTNIFAAATPAQTRDNILHLPLPDFSELRPGLDTAVVAILRKALQRDRTRRFQTAEEMMTALEVYLYEDGYGPTNEKLAGYLRDLYAHGVAYEEDRDQMPPSLGLPKASGN
jgi:eukaryotic-like serine/threonine-protein kinase